MLIQGSTSRSEIACTRWTAKPERIQGKWKSTQWERIKGTESIVFLEVRRSSFTQMFVVLKLALLALVCFQRRFIDLTKPHQ